MRVRIGFNADLEPDQGGKPMRIHADLDPGQTLPSPKVVFWHILGTGTVVVVNIAPKVPVQKPFRKAENKFNFGQFPDPWIQIRNTNTDPDPGEPNQSVRYPCRSWSVTLDFLSLLVWSCKMIKRLLKIFVYWCVPDLPSCLCFCWTTSTILCSAIVSRPLFATEKSCKALASCIEDVLCWNKSDDLNPVFSVVEP